jgi:hypothetical protein
MMSGGEGGWVKKCFLSLRQTALLSAEGKKVKTVNMQKLKPRHCGDRDCPPKEDEGESGRDTKGRRIQEDSKPRTKT